MFMLLMLLPFISPTQPALVGHTGVKLMLLAEPLACAGGANHVLPPLSVVHTMNTVLY